MVAFLLKMLLVICFNKKITFNTKSTVFRMPKWEQQFFRRPRMILDLGKKIFNIKL